jgi:hypothetical protein
MLTASSTVSSYDLRLTGTTPLQPTWLMISSRSTRWAGQQLPYKLDLLGMPNCVLGVDPQIMVAGLADASGTTTLSEPFTPVEAVVVYAQGLHLSSSIPAGIATTNVARSIVGAAGFCAYIYNLTVDGPIAQVGPNPWQASFLLRP